LTSSRRRLSFRCLGRREKLAASKRRRGCRSRVDPSQTATQGFRNRRSGPRGALQLAADNRSEPQRGPSTESGHAVLRKHHPRHDLEAVKARMLSSAPSTIFAPKPSLLDGCGLDRDARSFRCMSQHAQPQSETFDEDAFAKLLREQRESSRVGALALLLAVTSFVTGVALVVTTFIDQLR
jgi:hypothetical protein